MQLRVSDDHWVVVFGTRIVLAPMGIDWGRGDTHWDARLKAQQMYHESLERQARRAEKTAADARVGLSLLAQLGSA